MDNSNGLNVSKLRMYSKGLVAANKLPNSNLIEVVPIETASAVSGEISDNTEEYTAESVGVSGEVSKQSIKSTLSVEANWLRLGSGARLTSPDVRRGESVMIYQFADTDEYWWVDMGAHESIRRLETVVYGWNNNSKENTVGNSTNMYYFEVSTVNKTVTFHTSDNDGEYTTYDVQINTKEGLFTVLDGKSNVLQLNSPEKQWYIRNSDNSVIDMNKKVISFTAKDAINMTATNSVNISTKAYSLKASNSANITTASMTVDSPSTNITGNVSVGGDLQVAGNIAAPRASIGMLLVGGLGSITGATLVLQGSMATTTGTITDINT